MSRAAVLKFFLAGLAASLMAQTHDKAVAVNAAAVLPLPESMRAEATIAELGKDGAYKVVRQGSGDMICSAGIHANDTFVASCYHKLIFEAQRRGAELAAEETRRTGKP